MESLEEMRRELEQLRESWRKDHRELETLRDRSPATTIVLQRDRKLHRYTGGEGSAYCVDTWIEDAKSIIKSQALKGDEAVEFLLSHLDGAARNELRCWERRELKDPDMIFNIIKSSFGDKCTTSQLLRNYYERKQNNFESVAEYSRHLVELSRKLQISNPSQYTNCDQMLRDQFIENVKDSLLKWELRKIVANKTTASFLEVRNVAVRWDEEVQKRPNKDECVYVGSHVEQSNSAVNEKLQSLTDAVEQLTKQQQQMSEVLTEHHKLLIQLSESITVQTQPDKRPEFHCYECGEAGHMRRNCPVKRSRDDMRKLQWRSFKLQASTIHSPKMVEKLQFDNSIVGHSPTCIAMIGGIEVKCLVDTGSQVSTITVAFQ